MDLSIFLARLMGIYLLVVGFSVIIKHRALRKAVFNLVGKMLLLQVTGMFILILGLLLVLSHNIWDGSWRVLITLLSWGVLIKALLILLLPHSWLVKVMSLYSKKICYVLGGIASIVIGVYLVTVGF